MRITKDNCRSFGGEGGGRTHTHSEVRQILSLVRLPVPPLRHGSGSFSVANLYGNLHAGLSAKYTAFAAGGRYEVPDGKLELTVRDVLGNAVGEPVDVFLRNQTLSDTPAFRQLDVTNPVNITGLNVFPNGMYRIEVDSPSYHAVSRFVSIPPSGDGEVLITLPVNPRKVIRVDFPDFAALPQDARDLLGGSANVLSFAGKQG